MATLNISMPQQMREWIDAQIGSGHYANASDYVRDLIRHDQREKRAINTALIAGENSGVSSRSVSDIALQTKQRLTRE